MTKHWKRHAIVSLAVLALALFGSSLIASNMGFKIVRDDFVLNSNPAALNRFPVAIPHNSPWANSDEFLLDTWDGANFTTLAKYDNSLPDYVFRNVYLYGGYPYFSGTQFSINPGEGYMVDITVDLPGVTIVGSQDTSFTHPARIFNSNPAALNRFPISLTPNTTWTSSDDVLSAWFDGAAFLTLAKYDNSLPDYVFRNVYLYGGYPYFSGTQFALNPGESYFLDITADLGPQAQEPHY